MVYLGKEMVIQKKHFYIIGIKHYARRSYTPQVGIFFPCGKGQSFLPTENFTNIQLKAGGLNYNAHIAGSSTLKLYDNAAKTNITVSALLSSVDLLHSDRFLADDAYCYIDAEELGPIFTELAGNGIKNIEVYFIVGNRVYYTVRIIVGEASYHTKLMLGRVYDLSVIYMEEKK